MNIIRQIQPKGAPIIVDAQVDDEGNILRDTVRVYPIIPSDPPRIGEGFYSAPPKGREQEWLLLFQQPSKLRKKPKKDNETS